MQIRSLATLLRISRMGSFARVAEEQRTSVSTISMQMKSLEQDLGVSLFDRSFRPPRLTAKGLLVAEQARLMLDAENRIRLACESGQGLNGIFRIGFVATASVRILPGFLANAGMREPNARFEFETALSETLEARLRSGQLDLAVLTTSSLESTDLTFSALRHEPLVYAMPPNAENEGVLKVQEAYPFLQFNPVSGIGKLIEAHMKAEGLVNPANRIVLESVEAIMACVNNNLGFTLLAEPDIRRYASEDVTVKVTE
ncbi:MAG: LysR family transcriptional regulator, partial [Pseudomonadota bacterium]